MTQHRFERNYEQRFHAPIEGPFEPESSFMDDLLVWDLVADAVLVGIVLGMSLLFCGWLLGWEWDILWTWMIPVIAKLQQARL